VIGDDVVYLPLHHSLYILQPLVASSNSFEAVEKTSLVVEHLAADLYVAEIAAAEVGGSDDWSHSVWLLGMSSVNQDWRLVMATHDSTSERNSAFLLPTGMIVTSVGSGSRVPAAVAIAMVSYSKDSADGTGRWIRSNPVDVQSRAGLVAVAAIEVVVVMLEKHLLTQESRRQ
jgi:hypothetical protein